MAYTTNPHLPRVRAQAVELVRSGKSIRQVARHFGFAHNTVLNWLKRKPEYGWQGQLVIPTRSSRPHCHPRQLRDRIVKSILDLRRERNQCAEILHHRLSNEQNIKVSLSSVKRVLKRHHCSRFSRWKKWHKYSERPQADKPGILVQLDTIWDGIASNRLYVYTMIDVCSRWSYAWPSGRVSALRSLTFVRRGQETSPFKFKTLQSDHGSEFSKWFTKQINHLGVQHRYSRIRTPSDNGHLERFNRTLQEECLNKINRSLRAWQRGIPEYLNYYNTERPHMGLNMRTPLQVVRSY
jgi:transposase InsO family protein